MTQYVRSCADRLLEYVLPYPGERSWEEVKTHLGITDISLHKLISEVELIVPHAFYKSITVEGETVALGIKEEAKPQLLKLLEDGGFSNPGCSQHPV